MIAREWSVRTWLMPWVVAAAGALQVALANPSMAPGVVAVGLMAWIPLRRRAWEVSALLPWGMLLPFVGWWAALAVGGRAGPVELAGIAAWYLLLLALVQVLRGPVAGSWRCWNALAAALLAGFRPDGPQVALVLVQCLAILAHLRLDAADSGASRMRATWSAGIALAAMLSTVPLWTRWEIPSGAFDALRMEHSRKGFSPRLRLGQGFLFAGDPSDGEVVLRIWAKDPPEHLKGAVFDTYRGGSWSRSESWSSPTSSRNEREFSVFCLVSDTLEAPLGWARSEVPTDGFLLVPSGAGCAGVAADSIRMAGSGIWQVEGAGLERGWMWFAGQSPDRVLPAEGEVPPELEGVLEAAGIEAGIAPGIPTDSVAARLERWFATRFRYSLRVADPGDRDPLEAFLQDRSGYCEHFATAGALLARTAGVPARVATGYAYPSPLAGGWVARRANAHAWVELHDPRTGWRTWDPTPTGGLGVAPPPWWQRQIEGWTMRASRWWHVLRDGAWRVEVESLVEDATRRTQGGGGIFLVAFVLATGVWWIWRRRKTGLEGEDPRRGVWRRRARRAEDLLRRAGWVRHPGETIGEFLDRLPGDAPREAREELERYQSARWKES